MAVNKISDRLEEDDLFSVQEAAAAEDPAGVLDAVDQRVLWLAVRMIHEANHVRQSSDGLKVGGHQASSASVVSILVELYFRWLRHGDLVAVKPHASPAFHACQYLLGALERDRLGRLRALDGLQSYPNRTKDPDRVDFSTGSVGLGAVAPLFAAAVEDYLVGHGKLSVPQPPRRFVSVIGDAELDEGSVWEALVDDSIRRLGNVTVIVDANRQSLDRIVPGNRMPMIASMFRAAGWHVTEARHGRRLALLLAWPGGRALAEVLDGLDNEAFLALVRRPGAEIRSRLIASVPPVSRDALASELAAVSDEGIADLLMDAGGHDHAVLARALADVDAHPNQPSLVIAHTIKGWRLPFAGDPLNHTALLSSERLDQLAMDLGVDSDDPWAAFPPGSPEERLCRKRAIVLGRGLAVAGADGAEQTEPESSAAERPASGPATKVTVTGAVVPFRLSARGSTQGAFADALIGLARTQTGELLVTASSDVATSTGLGGWMNRTGIFGPNERIVGDPSSPLAWRISPHGRHVEFGISETNLFMWLGQAGMSEALFGVPLVPIGTVYDPFICRGLDALIYGLSNGGRFIVVGTPSGVSLAPEGGAHQSIVTPALGVDLPGLHAWEPAFMREVGWMLETAIDGCVDPVGGFSTYLRLSTRPVDQAPSERLAATLGVDEWRRQAIAGGYRLVVPGSGRRSSETPATRIVTVGATVTEALRATESLADSGIDVELIVVTSADRLAAQARRPAVAPAADKDDQLRALFPPERDGIPIVTVIDGAPHTLGFLGGVGAAPVYALGVETFGRSGTIPDLYRAHGIDADGIEQAVRLAVGSRRPRQGSRRGR